MYILKTVTTYRVPTVADALKLREWLDKTCIGELTSFTYKTKDIKVKGELVAQYQLVQATITIDSEKEPEGILPVKMEEDNHGEV